LIRDKFRDKIIQFASYHENVTKKREKSTIYRKILNKISQFFDKLGELSADKNRWPNGYL
jgi:hypothetical protein